MPGPFLTLDSEALAKLRALVQTMHAQNGQPRPLDQIVRLARDVQLDAGVTIDFQAAKDLGQPLVVLRMAPEQPAACLDVLSKREREVAGLLADGLSNKEIARRLFLSLATIKDHVHRILGKTGLPNRAAIAAAFRGHQPATAAKPQRNGKP